MQLPAIDQNSCGAWTQQQTDTYNKLPFYFMKGEVDTRKSWLVFQKLLGSIPWKPNQSDTMRRVGAEPTPVMRQTAYPNRIHTTRPLADIISYRERKLDAFVYMQDFLTPHFWFVPEWTDFMRHIDETVENVNRQITIYEDIFYRTMLTDKAPFVYVVGVGLVAAPTAIGNAAGTGALSKTLAWWSAQMNALLGVAEGYLTFSELFKILNSFEDEVGATPFDGSGTPRMDSAPLDGRFLLVGGSQVWNNFVDDPWVKENRPLSMNIVTEGFKGDLFGRIRYRAERWPRRFAFTAVVDGQQTAASYEPETIELSPNRDDFGRTIPNPLYTGVANSPYEVAYLVGRSPGDSIDVGPPPPEFTRNMSVGDGTKMNWNGKTYLTKNFLVPCADVDGNPTIEANSFGRYLRGQATASLGISVFNAQNFLPILFKRRIGINTIT